MNELPERLKYQLYKNCLDQSVTVDRYDLIELIQEYEIATGKKKRWNDEFWD